jgi:hypothetical protein
VRRGLALSALVTSVSVLWLVPVRSDVAVCHLVRRGGGPDFGAVEEPALCGAIGAGGSVRADQVAAPSGRRPRSLHDVFLQGVRAPNKDRLGMSAAENIKVVHRRVDALTIAYRVRLKPMLVHALRETRKISRKHGRAPFWWQVDAPDTEMGDAKGHRLGPARDKTHGPIRARWANDFDRKKRRQVVWGDLSFSRTQGVYLITNEDYCRIQIQERAKEGSGDPSKCSRCAGTGWIEPTAECFTRQPCAGCEGAGTLETPGYTVEIVWYAQELARSGLERCLEESSAIAAMLGEVLGERLRRIDLCSDVMGWKIEEGDTWNLDKRPHAQWSRRPLAKNDNNVEEWGKGAGLDRKLTGIGVGKGGSISMRIYDKRNELVRDARGERREAEEERWKKGGWDGEAPIARVEFQLRGEVLTELGIRDVDACLEPIYKAEPITTRSGREAIRERLVGHRLVVVKDEKGERQATLVDRISAIWSTCLHWVRIVTPTRTKSGKLKIVSRCDDDPGGRSFERSPSMRRSARSRSVATVRARRRARRKRSE